MPKPSTNGSQHANHPNDIQRIVLPIPDRPHVGLTTFDAKDPDTKYPPIRPLRPPKGAPTAARRPRTSIM